MIKPVVIKPTFDFENQYQGQCVLGIDEAGCGAWAGPLVTAGCVLAQSQVPESLLKNIDDSKKLSPQKRSDIFQQLTNHPAVNYQVYIVPTYKFNELGLSAAWRLSIQNLITQFPQSIDYVLLDGNRAPPADVPIKPLIKGDQLSYSIAAASIIAKVTRDQLMQNLSKQYPHYQWDTNAGYGTAAHQKALAEWGLTPHHRTCYKPVQKYVSHDTK